MFLKELQKTGDDKNYVWDRSCSKSIRNSQDYEEYDPLQESNVYFFINTVFFQILRIIAAQKMTMHVSPVGFPSWKRAALMQVSQLIWAKFARFCDQFL